VILSLSELCRISGQGKDNAETVMAGFLKYATVPVVNMEGATGHLTIPCRCDYHGRVQTEHRPKVVLSWAPHPKASGCSQFLCGNDAIAKADFVITHPEGYELNPEITKDSKIEYDQNKAFENADFIYTKNCS
jgi:N-succinyl-L-ornithine transcarbamylase